MTTELAVVLWQDRHVDTTVHLFTTFADAAAWAWDQAWEMEAHRNRPKVDWTRYPDGDLAIGYGVESDHLRVTTAVVDHELTNNRGG